MKETILNIYLVIEDHTVTGFRAKGYEMEGDDESKIVFLKDRAKTDFDSAIKFKAAVDRKGRFLSYNKFSKLERQGRHFELFEEIFYKYGVPENPLVCVTPFVDGKLICQ